MMVINIAIISDDLCLLCLSSLSCICVTFWCWCFAQASDALSRCGICQKSVPRSRLFDHKRTDHGRWHLKPRLNSRSFHLVTSSTETDSNANDVKKSRRFLSCPNCERQFSSASYLLRHYFVSHQQGGGAFSGKGEASGDSSGSAGKEEMDDKGAVNSHCRCRFCAKELGTVEALYAHEIEHVLKTRSSCVDSNKAFDTVDYHVSKIHSICVDSNKAFDKVDHASKIHSTCGYSNEALDTVDHVSKMHAVSFVDSNKELDTVR